MRQAEELKLIEALPPHIEDSKNEYFGKRKLGKMLPRTVSPAKTGFYREFYSLSFKDWSDDLRDQYNEWKKWVSADKKVAGNVNPYNRPATIENKTRKLEAFFGYLSTIKKK